MAAIKTYTDLSQSKVLAGILPRESADMEFMFLKRDNSMVSEVPFIKDGYEEPDCPYNMVPCWSLTALLNVLPKGEYKDVDLCFGGYQGDKYISEWFCSYEQQELFIIEVCHADNPIDACYEMILKLLVVKDSMLKVKKV